MEGLSQYSTLDPEADPLVGGLFPLALQDPSLFFFFRVTHNNLLLMILS